MLLLLAYLETQAGLSALVDCLVDLGIAEYDYRCLLISYSRLVLAHPKYYRVRVETFSTAL
jgi:hypothetical protein